MCLEGARTFAVMCGTCIVDLSNDATWFMEITGLDVSRVRLVDILDCNYAVLDVVAADYKDEQDVSYNVDIAGVSPGTAFVFCCYCFCWCLSSILLCYFVV